MKISVYITPVLQDILDFFPDIISFQHVFHLGVGRSQIEWKLKATTQIAVFPWAKIGQNDHSNSYIESTTVLSDIIIIFIFYLFILYVRPFWPPGTRWPRATRKRSRPDHTCKYIILFQYFSRIYTRAMFVSHAPWICQPLIRPPWHGGELSNGGSLPSQQRRERLVFIN